MLIIDSGHDLNARRRADRLGIAVGEADPVLSHAVEVWGAIGLTAIGSDAFEAHVVSHNEDDVWPIGGFRIESQSGEYEGDEEGRESHGLKMIEVSLYLSECSLGFG